MHWRGDCITVSSWPAVYVWRLPCAFVSQSSLTARLVNSPWAGGKPPTKWLAVRTCIGTGAMYYTARDCRIAGGVRLRSVCAEPHPIFPQPRTKMLLARNTRKTSTRSAGAVEVHATLKESNWSEGYWR